MFVKVKDAANLPKSLSILPTVAPHMNRHAICSALSTRARPPRPSSTRKPNLIRSIHPAMRATRIPRPPPILLLLLGSLLTLLGTHAQDLNRIRSITPDGTDRWHLEITGSTDPLFANYFSLVRIELSTNLVNWTPAINLLRTNLDPNPTTIALLSPANPAGFFRVNAPQAPTPFPLPGGPHTVGTRIWLLPDQPGRYQVATNSQMVAQVWYPCDGNHPLHPYEDPALALDPTWNSNPALFSNLVTHAQTDAPPASGTNLWPVIIYSHGGLLVRTDNQSKLATLASWGFVVIAADHPDTHAVALPSGQLAHSAADISTLTNLTAAQAAFQARLDDLTHILDQLATLNRGDSPLAKRLQLDRIGLCGHSFGAAAALEIARRDPRVTSVAHLDGLIYSGYRWATNLIHGQVGKPFLSLNRNDPNAPLDGDSLALFQRARSNALWMQIQSTAHGDFNDYNWVQSPYPPFRNLSTAMRAILVSFFRKTLSDTDDGLLANPAATYPIILNFRSK